MRYRLWVVSLTACLIVGNTEAFGKMSKEKKGEIKTYPYLFFLMHLLYCFALLMRLLYYIALPYAPISLPQAITGLFCFCLRKKRYVLMDND